MCPSRNLLTMDNIDIGWQLLMMDDSLDLGIGVIWAFFQSEGSSPTLIEMLNSLVTAGVILCPVSFNIFADKPSWPLALETSNLDKYSHYKEY